MTWLLAGGLVACAALVLYLLRCAYLLVRAIMAGPWGH